MKRYVIERDIPAVGRTWDRSPRCPCVAPAGARRRGHMSKRDKSRQSVWPCRVLRPAACRDDGRHWQERALFRRLPGRPAAVRHHWPSHRAKARSGSTIPQLSPPRRSQTAAADLTSQHWVARVPAFLKRITIGSYITNWFL